MTTGRQYYRGADIHLIASKVGWAARVNNGPPADLWDVVHSINTLTEAVLALTAATVQRDDPAMRQHWRQTIEDDD